MVPLRPASSRRSLPTEQSSIDSMFILSRFSIVGLLSSRPSASPSADQQITGAGSSFDNPFFQRAFYEYGSNNSAGPGQLPKYWVRRRHPAVHRQDG